jgi:uncharacterized membrane protein
MATLSAWKFPTADGADRAIATLQSLQDQMKIIIQDAAIVTWPADKKKPKTRQLQHLAGPGALGGAFWGYLFRLRFYVPIYGLAVGAAAGAVSGAMTDVGIDDNFIKDVRSQVTPGTSALFLLTSAAVIDAVKAALKGTGMTLISSNLTPEEEARLREAFAEEEPAPQAVQ